MMYDECCDRQKEGQLVWVGSCERDGRRDRRPSGATARQSIELATWYAMPSIIHYLVPKPLPMVDRCWSCVHASAKLTTRLANVST